MGALCILVQVLWTLISRLPRNLIRKRKVEKVRSDYMICHMS